MYVVSLTPVRPLLPPWHQHLPPPASPLTNCHCLLHRSWKTLVVNTPRTLQDVLPALMAEVIRALADPGAMCCR